MSKNISVDKKIHDIEIKMLRENENCFIKIVPIIQKSTQKKLFIMINCNDHQWDIYDQNGRDSHKIYLKGHKIKPCFYLLDGDESFRILCNIDKINIYKNSGEHNIQFFLKDNCNCISSKVSCWAVAIYMTSRKEKSPFCYM